MTYLFIIIEQIKAFILNKFSNSAFAIKGAEFIEDLTSNGCAANM